MDDNMFKSLSLVDLSGYLIITAILGLLAAGVALTFWLQGRYARLDRDLVRHATGSGKVHQVLERIFHDASEAQQDHAGDINTQAIVERAFHTELNALLLGERFVRANIGLMIILGLVGTFYGLTLSIGKLVSLVSGDVVGAAQLTHSLTRGLTEALAGMSVAFSTSLFGIVAAIVMTLLGVVFDIPSRRTASMVRIEAYLDNVLLRRMRGELGASAGVAAAAAVGPISDARLEQVAASLGQTVTQLHGAVDRFDEALTKFSTSTRDFQEFNSHLKDNIQRMSLSFGDLSETLKHRAGALDLRNRG